LNIQLNKIGEKRMKKIIFILFLVVAMMTLAACGTQESAPEPFAPETEQEAEAPAAEEPAPEESVAEEPAGAPAAEAGEPVIITMVTHETEVLNAAFWLNAIDAVLEDLPDNIEVEWSSTADRDAYAKQLAATDQFPDIPFAVTVSDFAEAGLLVPFDDAYL
jgi:ABC-type glycerol-3-phosphate transport system substrate-binding protein